VVHTVPILLYYGNGSEIGVAVFSQPLLFDCHRNISSLWHVVEQGSTWQRYWERKEGERYRRRERKLDQDLVALSTHAQSLQHDPAPPESPNLFSTEYMNVDRVVRVHHA
jgi:hypothetical protein